MIMADTFCWYGTNIPDNLINEIIKEYIPQDEIKNLIQEDLPFIKAEKTLLKDSNNYKLPSLELLKTPSSNERKKMDKNETNSACNKIIV